MSGDDRTLAVFLIFLASVCAIATVTIGGCCALHDLPFSEARTAFMTGIGLADAWIFTTACFCANTIK